MMTRYHMNQSVTGPLMNWSAKQWREATQWITRADGSRFTADELKREFLGLHAKGVKCIAIGNCDNFCDQEGCRGHPQLVPEVSQS